MTWFFGIMLFLTLVSFVLILVLKGEQKVFHKKTVFYTFGTIILFGLLGLTSFLVRPPGIWKMNSLYLILILAFLALGILHRYQMYRILNWSKRDNFKIEILYSLMLVFIGAISFSIVFWLIGRGDGKMDIGFADNISSGISLLLLPFFVIKSFDLWKSIPKKEVKIWTLPIDNQVPMIEPGRAVILHFNIPIQFDSKETIKFNTRAPVEKTIGEMFHFLLYRHNIEKRSYNKIQIAENKSKEKLYGWLFFTTEKKWWGTKKKYINPTLRIRTIGIKGGEVIHMKRVVHW